MSGYDPPRRALLMATPLLALLPAILIGGRADASPIDPSETSVTLPQDIQFKP